MWAGSAQRLSLPDQRSRRDCNGRPVVKAEQPCRLRYADTELALDRSEFTFVWRDRIFCSVPREICICVCAYVCVCIDRPAYKRYREQET